MKQYLVKIYLPSIPHKIATNRESQLWREADPIGSWQEQQGDKNFRHSLGNHQGSENKQIWLLFYFLLSGMTFYTCPNKKAFGSRLNRVVFFTGTPLKVLSVRLHSKFRGARGRARNRGIPKTYPDLVPISRPFWSHCKSLWCKILWWRHSLV